MQRIGDAGDEEGGDGERERELAAERGELGEIDPAGEEPEEGERNQVTGSAAGRSGEEGGEAAHQGSGGWATAGAVG